MLTNANLLNELNSPVRKLNVKATIYKDSDIVYSCYKSAIKEVTIERIGDNTKFFGYGVCQKLHLKLIDVNRTYSISTENIIRIAVGDKDNITITPYPPFYVTEVHRNENNNELSITAYDAIYKASNHTVSELSISAPYTIEEFAVACANLLEATAIEKRSISSSETCFSTSYEEGANFEGTETIREALNAVAEATQTIYFMSRTDGSKIIFKRLSESNSTSVFSIDKSKYFSLKSKSNRRLSAISHVTDLGDNVSASITESGTTQYIRNNPFWDLRDDVATLVDKAITAVGGLTINQFECDWRGNFLLEIGDKITLVTKDDNTVSSYILNDSVKFDGALSEHTEWNYEENDDETEDNPSTLGDAIKQTYAKVDKANKKIDLVASNIQTNSESISALELNIDSISASVSNMETNITESIDAVNGEIETLTNKVEATMTSEQVKIEIQSELSNGVTKVETNTGFIFDDEGLTVEKSDSEMKTQITEDGMTVYKNSESVLVANNVGVEAVNLHATTYLIIGNNSRFENYNDTRTGCFWIGGV